VSESSEHNDKFLELIPGENSSRATVRVHVIKTHHRICFENETEESVDLVIEPMEAQGVRAQ